MKLQRVCKNVPVCVSFYTSIEKTMSKVSGSSSEYEALSYANIVQIAKQYGVLSLGKRTKKMLIERIVEFESSPGSQPIDLYSPSESESEFVDDISTESVLQSLEQVMQDDEAQVVQQQEEQNVQQQEEQDVQQDVQDEVVQQQKEQDVQQDVQDEVVQQQEEQDVQQDVQDVQQQEVQEAQDIQVVKNVVDDILSILTETESESDSDMHDVQNTKQSINHIKHIEQDEPENVPNVPIRRIEVGSLICVEDQPDERFIVRRLFHDPIGGHLVECVPERRKYTSRLTTLKVDIICACA